MIRKAAPEDIPAMLPELERFSGKLGMKTDLYPGDDVSKAIVLDHILNHIVLIAERDGRLAGFIIGRFAAHAYNPKVTVLSHRAWWVVKKFRKQGIGTALLKEFMKIGKGCVDIITLQLRKDTNVSDTALGKLELFQAERIYAWER